MTMPALLTRDLMTTELVTVRPTDGLARAAREMRLARIRHLPVVDDRGRLVGIITERDLLVARDRAGRVLDHMRTDIKYVHPDSPAHEAAYLLLRHRIGCVPVVDGDDHLRGLVTDTDFVRVAYTVLGGAVPVDELEAEEREAEHV
jgi:CBS domain-containing protein